MRITYVGLMAALVVYAQGGPLPDISKVKSPEDLQALADQRRKQSRENKLRGRRQLEDGSLERSSFILAKDFGGNSGFYHSVASGDPLSDSVIIWTRYTPESVDDQVLLEFRIAEVRDTIAFDAHLDPALNPELKRGTALVTMESDFTVKIDVKGLASNTNYVYTFTDGSVSSDVGETRTAPAEDDDETELVYALFSCSHFRNGYFHAYDIASTITDLDVWIHVGDYYYELGLFDTYASDAASERDPFILPIWETIDLQDYRLRHHTHVAHDEGLRNLRRRAPMIATWDDHEATNDNWGNLAQGAGAENHQPTCPVNSTATDEEKEEANCDRPEGDAIERFSNAFVAYMEWMPIRWMPGSMGNSMLGSFTQIINWGDLATIVSFDSRTSYRSEESTGQDAFAFYGAIGLDTNFSSYSDPNSATFANLQAARDFDNSVNFNPEFSMIGDNLDVLQDAFVESKESGKPWQIFASNTMMGHNVLFDVSRLAEFSPPQAQPSVQGLTDFILGEPTIGFTARLLVAMAQVQAEWNRDDFGGFRHERAQILEMAKESANNMIVLGGDLHDSFGWVLSEGGLGEGPPVAVNIGCPGVTAPGLLPIFASIFDSVIGLLGGMDGLGAAVEAATLATNPNLRHVNYSRLGFTAAKATKDTHVAEWFGIDPSILLTNYGAARDLSGGITAEATCLDSATTYADQPGSLDINAECSAISFDSTRPATYALPVPIGDMPTGETLEGCGFEGCDFLAANVMTTEPTSGPTVVANIQPAGPPMKMGMMMMERMMGEMMMMERMMGERMMMMEMGY